jgi:hypothetical protein
MKEKEKIIALGQLVLKNLKIAHGILMDTDWFDKETDCELDMWIHFLDLWPHWFTTEATISQLERTSSVYMEHKRFVSRHENLVFENSIKAVSKLVSE